MDKHKLCMISVALVIFTVTVLILKIFATRRKRKLPLQNQAPTPLTDVVVVNENASFDPSLKVSMRDIVAATKSFSYEQLIGSGSFGPVYKAKLADGRNLAVKRLGTDAYHDYRRFRSELEILGNLRHRNIARLLGYCVSGEDKVLIYEFFEKGSLDICLCEESLSWKTRVNVVKGVANGLAYLHELENPIIHRKVHPQNILLGLEFEAHICDFGLARRVESSRNHVTTEECVVSGYTPPEYHGYKTATTKGDVYSFGVLMLVVATCMHCFTMPVEEGEGLVLLSEWARDMASQNREVEMLDPRGFQGLISKVVLVEANIKEYFRIALLCADPNPIERPNMRDVVELLREL